MGVNPMPLEHDYAAEEAQDNLSLRQWHPDAEVRRCRALLLKGRARRDLIQPAEAKRMLEFLKTYEPEQHVPEQHPSVPEPRPRAQLPEMLRLGYNVHDTNVATPMAKNVWRPR